MTTTTTIRNQIMTTDDFNDMVDAIADKITSVKSTATPQERVAEVVALQRMVAALREAHWPKRLAQKHKARALRIWDNAASIIDNITKPE